MQNITADALFGALANLNRLRCVVLLQQEGELCVCELTQALVLAQPVVSRHLARLREDGIVLDRREGLWIHYRIHPQLPSWARGVVRTTIKGVAAGRPFLADLQRLRALSDRPAKRLCA